MCISRLHHDCTRTGSRKEVARHLSSSLLLGRPRPSDTAPDCPLWRSYAAGLATSDYRTAAPKNMAPTSPPSFSATTAISAHSTSSSRCVIRSSKRPASTRASLGRSAPRPERRAGSTGVTLDQHSHRHRRFVLSRPRRSVVPATGAKGTVGAPFVGPRGISRGNLGG